jgi:hypothetical protein
LQDGFELRELPRLVRSLACPSLVPEVALRCSPRLRWRHASRDIFFDQKVEMRMHLFAEIVIQIAPPLQ